MKNPLRNSLAACVAALALVLLAALAPSAAAQEEKTDTEQLLQAELNKFASDENGWTHLHWAALLDDGEAARRLLTLGAFVESLAKTDQSAFSEKGQGRARLVGKNMSDWQNAGQSPLAVASALDSPVVASVLFAAGADPIAAGLIAHLRGTPPPTGTKTEKRMREKDAWGGQLDVNARVKPEGWDGNHSHLHVAAWENDMEAAGWLIANGAKVNAKNEIGFTPLAVTAEKNAAEVAKLLIANGADVNAKGNDGRTPLHEAVGRNAAEVAKLLVANGADVNAKHNKGVTPLDFAIYYEHGAMRSLLRQHGGRCNVKC